MKIFHIESGLGNQMLSYCEYLAARKVDQNEKCYIENIIYDIPECNDVICQWNGYELERIFGIKAANIKELFDNKRWNQIISEIRDSRFWERNWNYPVHFTAAFNHAGLSIQNIRGDFEEPAFIKIYSGEKTFKSQCIDTYAGQFVKRLYYKMTEKKKLAEVNNTKNIFCTASCDVFTGQWLSFKYRCNDIDKIESEIRSTFVFPKFGDEKNIKMADFLSTHNAVAIHARRGDMLGVNEYCYKFGYFQRAISFLKKKVENPVFVFFCDPGSVEWCKQNEKIFGLDFKKDQVLFVDWNKGLESYRDMQLMSLCKYAVITNSSFGWWGAYLIKYPEKITISPDITINTTHHF